MRHERGFKSDSRDNLIRVALQPNTVWSWTVRSVSISNQDGKNWVARSIEWLKLRYGTQSDGPVLVLSVYEGGPHARERFGVTVLAKVLTPR